MRMHRKSDSGFTLLEIIVVVAIIGLIAVIAVPSVRGWKQRSDLNADMRRLYGFFQKARLEAVKRSTDCYIVSDQVVNGVQYDYVSFIDSEPPDANNNGVYDAGELVTHTGFYTSGVTAAAAYANSFDRRGLINSATTIRLQSTSGAQHDLIINIRGKMRIQ